MSIEHIGHESLNAGKNKINANFDELQTKANAAVSTANTAKSTADTAKTTADNVKAEFDQVIIEGDSSVEAAAARVNADASHSYGNLKERLDTEYNAVNSQLADIPYQIDSKIGTLGSNRIFKGSCLNSALPTTPTTQNDYWFISDLNTNKAWNGTAWVDIGNVLKIGDGSITPAKTNNQIPNTKNSNNLFVKANAVLGKYINKTTGIETVNAAYGYVVLPVIAGEFFFVLNNISTNQEGAWFDSGGVYISALFTGVTYAINPLKNKYVLKAPSNAVTLKLNFLMTEIDNVIIFQDSTKVHTSNTVEDKWLNTNAVKRSDTPFIENIKTRIDSSSILDYTFINNLGGLTVSASYNSLAPFPVVEGEKYLVENWLPLTTLPSALSSRGVFLDSNFTFVGAVPVIDSYSPEYTVPVGAAYMTVLYDATLAAMLSVRRTYTSDTKILISKDSIYPPIDNIFQSVVGENGKLLKVVACVIRNDGTGWKQITGAHDAVNIASIANDNSKITITYNFTALKVVSFVACPDETMASEFMLMGASVGINTALINLYQNKSMGGYIYYNGTDWVFSSAEGVSGVFFNAGILTITHSPITGIKGSVTSITGALITNLGSLGSTTTEVYFRDYAGALITAPTADMKIYFERKSSGLTVSPDSYVNPNGNIWCLGVFEV